MPEPEPLARNRDFKVLLASQGVSALGDAVSFTALPLLVLALTGSGLMMGIVGAIQTLPDLVFGMVAGALADRSDRRRMMFVADAGRAVLTMLIPISVLLGGPTMAVVLIVAAPMSVLRTLFLSAYTASVPALVGRAQVARANSIFEAIYSTGYIVGPAIAGLLSATIGPGLTLAIDAVSFGGSAIALAAVRSDLRAPIDRQPASLLTDVREGITFVVQHPLLRSMVAFWGLVAITTAPLVTALAVHVTRDLAMTDAILGLLLTAYGVGTVVGSLLTARGARGPLAPALLGGTLVTGALLIALTTTNEIPLMLAIAAIAGVSQSVVLVTYLTTRTSHSPDALLGRVGSVARTISLGLQPLGLLAGGALIDLTDGSTTIAVMGAMLIVLSLAFAPLRALRGATVTPATRPQA
jgi:MFS transporter, ENTS family, enterobactin (siderophore) exporter